MRGTITTIVLPAALLVFGWVLGHEDDPVLVVGSLIIEAALFGLATLAVINLSLSMRFLRRCLLDLERGVVVKPHSVLAASWVLAEPRPDFFDGVVIILGVVLHTTMYAYLIIHYFVPQLHFP